MYFRNQIHLYPSEIWFLLKRIMICFLEINQLKEILYQSNDKIAGHAQELSMNNE